MPWEGEDRRRRITNDTPHRRRRDDFDDIVDQLRDAQERLIDAEQDVQSLHVLVTGLLTSVGNIDGKVDVLTDLCRKIDGKTGFNFTTFLATVVVPLLVVLLTGYFAIKAQAPQVLPK